MRLDAHQTIALVVDVQDRLYPHMHDADTMVQRCAMLIRGLRVLEVPLIVTEQYPKGLGTTIAPIREAVGDYQPIEKITFSCMGSEEVEAHILGMARHQVIVMGVEAHVCVQQTVLDLLQMGQTPILVRDAVTSRRLADADVAVERMRQAGAIVTTAESLLFELLRKAGTDSFKAISALVK